MDPCCRSLFAQTYHKFVKTTPKPNATKNNNGELVGPPPPPVPLGGAEVAAGLGEIELLGMPERVVDDMMARRIHNPDHDQRRREVLQRTCPIDSHSMADQSDVNCDSKQQFGRMLLVGAGEFGFHTPNRTMPTGGRGAALVAPHRARCPERPVSGWRPKRSL